MKPQVSSIPAVVIDEASSWLVALRESDASADVRGAFADWLRLSPMHVRAYLEVMQLWFDAAHIRKDFVADVESTDGAPLHPHSSVISLSVPDPALTYPSTVAYARRRPLVLRAAAALSILALACAGVVWKMQPPSYSAAVGEQRILTLEDGSLIDLNSRASIRVRFSRQSREIDLLAGRAFFQVAKDAARPFIVRSGRTAVRAVGTEFDVFHRMNGTTVTVVEGRVQVNAPIEAGEVGGGMQRSTVQAIVVAGEQAMVPVSGRIERNAHANTAAATSWLRQELVFDGATLSDVLEELNQYSRRQFIVTDPVLAQMRISAVLHSTNPDSFLRYLKSLSGVIVDESESEVRISRQQER